MDKKISVIIPVYNAANSINKCVESLAFGKYGNLDIILIDDCSKDDSWKVCKELAKNNKAVRCYQNEKNSGVSYTRNHGLNEACGEYILFVDSDDWVSCRYAKTLFSTIEENKDALVICGLHFIDNVNNYSMDYLWKNGTNKIEKVYKNDFFQLPSAFLLQQLWNKIFRKDIIDKYNIRFDVTQSMGEDYQFVLEYMEALKCNYSVIINEPLYYYIRANNTSLMSQFGVSNKENEYIRIAKLRDICGSSDEKINSEYFQKIADVKQNYIYYCVHNKEMSKKEKLEYIESIMKDGNAKKYYATQNKVRKKENIVESIQKSRKSLSKINSRINRIRTNLIIKKVKSKLTVSEFTIISQNCLSGVFYHDMGIQFQSPTINLYFSCPDLIKFVLNFNYYIKLEPVMTWGEKYPIGYLDDIQINFMHYETCSEALKKWMERRKRINENKLIVFCTDMENFDDTVYEQWKKIEYPKLLFTANKKYTEDALYFPKYQSSGKVKDLIPKREFYKDDAIIKIINKMK